MVDKQFIHPIGFVLKRFIWGCKKSMFILVGDYESSSTLSLYAVRCTVYMLRKMDATKLKQEQHTHTHTRWFSVAERNTVFHSRSRKSY